MGTVQYKDKKLLFFHTWRIFFFFFFPNMILVLTEMSKTEGYDQNNNNYAHNLLYWRYLVAYLNSYGLDSAVSNRPNLNYYIYLLGEGGRGHQDDGRSQ